MLWPSLSKSTCDANRALQVCSAHICAVCMVILLACENDQHGLNSTAPARRLVSAHWGEPAALATGRGGRF